jgi:bla regulator protein BlaR1
MTSWLLHTFVAISLLIALVLALRQPVARLFGAGWAYSLWLIPALRLVLPPLPWPVQDLPLSVAVLIPAAAGGTAPPPALAGSGQWVPFLLATWAGGAVIFIILQWLGYRAFLRRLSGNSRPARPPRYGGIATFVSRVVEGPLALGLIERRIVIPSDFSRRYSPGERRLAMEHELTHHRHRDIWWNVAAIAVLALNWFNPLAWLAYRAFRADQELACDAAVAARATIEERCDYARALVKSATGPRLIAACPINGAGTLKRRLRMLRGHRASPARSAGGVAALSVLALAGMTSATLRSAPAQLPQRLAETAARPAPASAPVRLTAASLPAGTDRADRPIVVRARHAGLRFARALPMPPAPTLELRQLARLEIAPALRSVALAPRRGLAAMPDAPTVRTWVRLADGFEVTGRSADGRTLVFRVTDPAQRARIEEALRKAVAEARQAQAQAEPSVQLAQLVTFSRSDGAWARVKLQIVDQGDYQ